MNVKDFAFAIIIGTERMISKLRQGNQKAIRAFLGVVLYCPCSWKTTHTGKITRNLNEWLTEHKRASRNSDFNNNIAERHLKAKRAVDWDSATCLPTSRTATKPLFLESWFTTSEQSPFKRSQPLPAPCKRLLERNGMVLCYFYHRFLLHFYLFSYRTDLRQTTTTNGSKRTIITLHSS